MADTLLIENTTFGPIVKKILKSGKKPIRFKYDVILHTVKEDIKVTKLLAIDMLRDYAGKVGDAGSAEFMVPLGVYNRKIYPYRTNLELTIKRTELQETGGSAEKNKKVLVVRYKAIFLADANPACAASGLETIQEETLNIANVVQMSVQIADRSLEPLRIATTFGVYKLKTPEEVIRGVMQATSESIIVDGKPSIDGVDIVQPDNVTKLKHILLPHGLKLINVPTFIQDKACGVYSAGIGTYLQLYKEKKLWFVFPLFDHKRFDDNVPKAIFYALPENKYEGLDRSYNEDGKLLQVLITSKREYTDQADLDSMNDGNGVRVADASSFMHKPIEITANGPKAKRTSLNREVTASSREDGLNFSPVSDARITSNPYLEYSKVLARMVGTVNLVWENADPELLYPGMPCKYIVTMDKKPVEFKGTILKVRTYTSTESDGPSSTEYRTSAQVTISVEPYNSIPKVSKNTPKGIK